MILLAGKNTTGNVLHVIKGSESDVWEELHGSSVIDITPLLKHMDETAPVYLQLSECKSEVELGANLHHLLESGAKYPFEPPSVMFTTQTQTDGMAPASNVQSPVSTMYNNHVPKRTNKKPGKCSRCGAEEIELVPGLRPAICYNCVNIDLQLAAKMKDKGDNK